MDIIRLRHRILNFASALDCNAPVKLVAIGSSSTAGREEVLPYPCRLEFELRKLLSYRAIDVLNRGIGGQEAPEELARFHGDVVLQAPTLVIWQIGTNAVFHPEKYDVVAVAEKLNQGLLQLQALGFEVVLMDPQYVPAMLERDRIDNTTEMVSLIEAEARSAGVNLFRRFALMKSWHDQDRIEPADMIDLGDPDRLHQNDWSTAAVSKAFAMAIQEAVKRPPSPQVLG